MIGAANLCAKYETVERAAVATVRLERNTSYTPGESENMGRKQVSKKRGCKTVKIRTLQVIGDGGDDDDDNDAQSRRAVFLCEIYSLRWSILY